MIRPRRSEERGRFDHGWLDTRHAFSFGDYRDPRHEGYSVLRVLNEDRVQPGEGFGAHSHRDMEILSIVLAGALEHRDSLGTGSVIRAGDVQRMTAGTGVTHSEQNASSVEPVHFLQVWILPERLGLQPGYEQRSFPEAELRGRLRLVASRDGRDGSVVVHQDAQVLRTLLWPGHAVSHDVAPGRRAWVQVARGSVSLDGTVLAAGDGAAISGEPNVSIEAVVDADVLVFDLP